jgi:flagellar basal body rod protein FlgC
MGSGMSISAAGIQAASRWFSAAASNIVSDTSGKPADPTSNGGSPQTSLLAYDPQAPYANVQTMINPPGSDLATEMVHLREAKNSFEANLAAFKTSSQMLKSLLDATA